MKKKFFYEAPESELLLVRFEENILQSRVDTQGVNPGKFNGYNDEVEW